MILKLHFWALISFKFTSYHDYTRSSHGVVILFVFDSTWAALQWNPRSCRRWYVRPAWTRFPSCGHMLLTLQVISHPELLVTGSKYKPSCLTSREQFIHLSFPFSTTCDQRQSSWGGGRSRCRGRSRKGGSLWVQSKKWAWGAVHQCWAHKAGGEEPLPVSMFAWRVCQFRG